MYRRILVVTGDQSWSDAPVQYAIALAAETGAELAILMALMPPLIAGTADIMACTLIVERMVAESESMLVDRKNKRYFATATARTTRHIPLVSFFSPTKHFACILNK
jgi:nucleotide-binding universal stress UspA family protein